VGKIVGLARDQEISTMSTPDARRTTDPRAICELISFHANEMTPYLLPPAGLDPAGQDPAVVRLLAVQAASYALAAFDPQDAVEAVQVRGILMMAHMALRPVNPDALVRRLWSTVIMLVKALEDRQRWMRMRVEPPIPGRRRKQPVQREMPPVVRLAAGMTHWLDLVADPELRRRLDPMAG
jgi:hypothetical protein